MDDVNEILQQQQANEVLMLTETDITPESAANDFKFKIQDTRRLSDSVPFLSLNTTYRQQQYYKDFLGFIVSCYTHTHMLCVCVHKSTYSLAMGSYI